MSPESVENLLDALAHARAQAEAVGERMAQLIKDLIPTEIAKQIDDVRAELEPERKAIEEQADIIDDRTSTPSLTEEDHNGTEAESQ